MQVKRFRAASMKEALDAVKNEFGEDAVILKSEVVPSSGFFDLMKRDAIEVVAAVDIDMPTDLEYNAGTPKSGGGRVSYFKPVQSNMPKQNTQSAKESDAFNHLLHQEFNDRKTKTTVHPSAQNAHAEQKKSSSPAKTQKAPDKKQKEIQESVNELNSLKQELDELRSAFTHIQRQMAPEVTFSMKEFADMPASLAQEMMMLIEVGVERHIAKLLLEKTAAAIPPDQHHDKQVLRETLIQQMSQRIVTSGPIECIKGKTKVIVLVGPTGCGKTTTLAKLAANSKFNFNKKVALISADTYRVSAIEHLNTFAGIAQIPISAVYTPSELKSALAAHQDKDLVFIDTAGRSPKDEKYLPDLQKFLESADPDEIHLVLPANMTSLDLFDVIRRFNMLKVNRLIVTKIDETNALGSLVNIAMEGKYPLSYISDGQTIPDDIKLAESQSLSRMILRTV